MMAVYPVRDRKSLSSINDKINTLFKEKASFSIIRIGNMEGYFLDCINKKEQPVDEFFHWLSLTSGVFPHDMDYLTNTWAPINHQAMINADILGFVDVSGHVKQNENFNQLYCSNKDTFYGVDDILVLDPGYLTNKGIVDVPCGNPWTRNLKGKKVLVVSAFVNSIKQQWSNIDKIWGVSKDDIVPFDLVDVIRAPFHPMMDERQKPEWTSWDKTRESLNAEIDTYEYDVLLTSAGAMAPALSNHAKEQGKIGITICGTLQLFFGLVGPRWAGQAQQYIDWARMFNQHWAWPAQVDTPHNKELFSRIENAYWK